MTFGDTATDTPPPHVTGHFLTFWNYIPYILAYKSRNFGQYLDKIWSIRLILGSQKNYPKMYQIHLIRVSKPYIHKNKALYFSNFGHLLSNFFFNSTYTRVYTVIWSLTWKPSSARASLAFVKVWVNCWAKQIFWLISDSQKAKEGIKTIKYCRVCQGSWPS